MAFDVDRIRSVISRYGGEQRPTQFEVFVLPPASLFGKLGIVGAGLAATELRFLCEAASIPGRNINTIPFRFYGKGYTAPTSGYEDTELNLTFIGTNISPERQLFHTWMNECSNFNTYNVGYYNDIIGTIQIVKYAQDGLPTLTQYTFEEAFPISIAETPLNWGSYNEVTKTVVQIKYHKWKMQPVDLILKNFDK